MLNNRSDGLKTNIHTLIVTGWAVRVLFKCQSVVSKVFNNRGHFLSETLYCLLSNILEKVLYSQPI